MKDLDWHNKTVCEKLAKGKKMADKIGNVTGTEAREKSKKSDLYSYLCWRCSKARRRVRCPGCRTARYCGEKCRLEDWKEHRGWCGRKQKAVLEVPVNLGPLKWSQMILHTQKCVV